MNKKQVLFLLIAINLIAIGVLLSLLISFILNRSRPNTSITPTPSGRKPDIVEVQSKPEQTTHADINSIIAQYDVIKRGRYKEVMDTYSKVIRMEPPYTADTRTMVRNYAERGNYDKAIEEGLGYIQHAPEAPDNFYALAWIYTKVGRYDEAMKVCQKTIQLHPRYSKIWQISGWIHAKNGEYDKTIEDCNQAVKLDPLSAQTYYALGRLYGVLGRDKEAIDAYKKAIQLKPEEAAFHFFLGLTYAKLGNLNEAIKSYQDAILANKYYPEPYVFSGMAYDESGQYQKAIESFKKTLDMYTLDEKARIQSFGLRPDLSNIYFGIGVCNLSLGQNYEASTYFKKAIEIDNSLAEAHYGLALAQLLIGNKDLALEEYKAVKALKGAEAAKPLLDIINKAEQ
jgi:tetratricopeptide (TPR) repeat protein